MKLKALTPIRHDGVLHPPGAVMEMTDAQGEALVKAGAAVRIGEALPPASGEEAGATPPPPTPKPRRKAPVKPVAISQG